MLHFFFNNVYSYKSKQCINGQHGKPPHLLYTLVSVNSFIAIALLTILLELHCELFYCNCIVNSFIAIALLFDNITGSSCRERIIHILATGEWDRLKLIKRIKEGMLINLSSIALCCGEI